MDIPFEKQYNPPLDCCLLLRNRFLDGEPKLVVESSLNRLSATYGIPIEQLQTIAAPSLNLEEHIVENLSAPEERLRFYFPSRKMEDGVVGLGFWLIRRMGVCFRELNPEQLKWPKCLLLHMISGVDLDPLTQVSDISDLILLLEQHHCTDHTLRLCLGLYLNPALNQEEFNGILDEAVALYEEKIDLLPPPHQCTFELFQKNWDAGGNLRILNSSLPKQGNTTFILSPFEICNHRSITNDVPEPEHWFIAGIWDDRIIDLIKKYDYSVSKLTVKLKVLSDQRRLEILGTLCESPQTVDYLSKRFSMSPALLSYHLDQLFREGLINREFGGKSYRYSLNYPQLQMLLQNLKHYLKIPDQEPPASTQPGRNPET